MAKRGVKKKEHERLDDPTVGRVVSLLNQENPITKKQACEILNISYNTTRLNKIIEEYKEKQDFIKLRKSQNKGKPFNDMELKDLVISYLSGDSITKIADRMYRSPNVVKNKINSLNLPVRDKDATYHNPSMAPDEAVSETYSPGEYVWSCRYNCVVEIRKFVEYSARHLSNIYRIWVFGKYNQFALQPAYELAKLDVLKNFSLNQDEFVTTETPNFAYRIE